MTELIHIDPYLHIKPGLQFWRSVDVLYGQTEDNDSLVIKTIYTDEYDKIRCGVCVWRDREETELEYLGEWPIEHVYKYAQIRVSDD